MIPKKPRGSLAIIQLANMYLFVCIYLFICRLGQSADQTILCDSIIIGVWSFQFRLIYQFDL